jgi:ABC-type glycerol-3-phosphate transport system substrate-binding protein
MKNKKLLVALIAAIALLFVAQGVFASGSSEQPSTSSSTTTSSSSSAGGNLTFWNMPFVTQEVSPSYVQSWEQNVKTALPNYKVASYFGPGDYGTLRKTFLVQAQTGTPDVIEGLLEDVPVYVQKGDIEPLDSYFNSWSEASQFEKSTLAPLTINGKLYGIPYNTNARGLIYRTDVLAKYNLPVPKTWTDLVSEARTITKNSNKQMWGLFLCSKVGDPRAPQEFISWYYQVSGGKNMFTVNGSNVTFNGTVDQFQKILTLYQEAFSGSDPAVDPAEPGNGWPSEDPGYAAGKWAMAPMGPWLWGRRKGDATAAQNLDNSKIAPLPIPQGGQHYTYLEVKPIMMNAYSKDKAGAWKLIEFITSAKEMAGWDASSGGIPARKDALDLPEFQGPLGNWIKMFAANVPTGVAQAPVNWGPVSDAEMRAVDYVIYGQKNPADAAQWLYDQINGIVSSGKIL